MSKKILLSNKIVYDNFNEFKQLLEELLPKTNNEKRKQIKITMKKRL